MSPAAVARTRELLQKYGDAAYVPLDLFKEELASSQAEAAELIAEAQKPAVEPAQQPALIVVTANGGNAVERSEQRDCPTPMHTPLTGALHAAAYGIPQIPLRPHTKIAFQDSWPKLATTDAAQINNWSAQYRDCNFGSVSEAQTGGTWVFEIDNLEAAKALGLPKLAKTFRVRSRPGRGHNYLRHNAPSLALFAELDKAYVSIKDAYGKEIASARLNHSYCVTANSIHPVTNLPYEIVSDVEPIDASQELIDWIREHAAQDKKLPVTASSDGPRVPRGSHDDELIRIAGKLRGDGLEYDEILPILIRNVEERFDDVGSDWREMCENKAKSICRYPKGNGSIPLTPAMQARIAQQTTAAVADDDGEPETDDTGLTPRPVFPAWVMEGTSLYEHLVKPVVAASSKYPELVFMPGVLMFINAIALRVRLVQHHSVPNIFLGLISPYGKFFKSSSCEVAMEFFKKAGFAASYSMKVPNVAITTLILAPGSPEGAALQMKRVQGSKAVFYYDELGSFCSKATIEHSALLDKLLSWYEAKEDGNQIKANQSSYHFESNKYCFSWLWCTTDRKLPALWGKLMGSDSGLNNRVFFVLSPEREKESGLYTEPDFDTTETTNRITAALIHNPVDGVGTYDYEDAGDTAAKIKGLDPRSQALLEHLALYFAIDLGRDAIDIDCCERALKLVEYRNSVEAFLDLFQSESKEGQLSHEIMRELKRNHGKMPYRELYHELHAVDRGLKFWNATVDTLRANGVIATRQAKAGKGSEQRPAMVYLLKENL